jgi:hypothetical protein
VSAGSALQELVEEGVIKVLPQLPALQNLFLEEFGPDQETVETFVAARQVSA